MTNLVISLAFIACVGAVSPFVGRILVSAVRKEKEYISQLFDRGIRLNEELKTKLNSAIAKSSVTHSKVDSVLSDARDTAASILLTGREDISIMVEGLIEDATRQFEIKIDEEKEKLVDVILKIAEITTEELVKKNIKGSSINTQVISEISKQISKAPPSTSTTEK